MSHPERNIFAASEHKVTGTSLVGTSDSDRVQIESTHLEDGGVRYSVSSRLEMGRSAITAIMATPLHYPKEKWEPVRDGLRDISYPSQRVNRASRNTQKRAHLSAVGPASRELADIMTNNQSFRTQTANVPVFTSTDSYKFANEEILRRTSAGKLVILLKSIGIDAATARQLSEFAYFSSQSDEVAKQLQIISGMSDEEMRETENAAILERIDPRVWTELVHRLQEDMFIGFIREVSFDNDGLRHGGTDKAVYIREEDVPTNISQSNRGASVEVGRKMRDPDKKTGLDRYEVAFQTQEPEIVANPLLAWERHGHRRQFVYPVSTFETSYDGHVSRKSSMLGAALAANYGRFKYGIGYSETLNNRLFPRKKWNSSNWGGMLASGAGMLPLVINHQETKLLKDDYFLAIEEALE